MQEVKIKEVQIQLIQSATLLIHNLSSEKCIRKNYLEYLLNTLFYKEIVSFTFDFSDEEIVEIYMSMLKAFATNLKEEVLSEFLSVNSFSVMSGAMMFMNYHESMIKTASRTVILRIFSLKPKDIKDYMVKSGFFNCFVSMLSDKLSLCDRYIMSLNSSKLESSLSEVLEDLYYVNDIFGLQIVEFSEILTELLLKSLIFPIAIGSLGSVQHFVYHISIPLAAVFLYQTLHIVKHADLVNSLVMGLLVPQLPPDLVEALQESPSPGLQVKNDIIWSVNSMLDHLEGFDQIPFLVQNSIPEVIFSFLTSKDNNLVGVILMLLNAVISSTSVNTNLLLAAGLISFTKLKIKKLMSSILEEKEKTMSYDEATVEKLLKMVGNQEPLRVFQFKLACNIITSLAFRNDTSTCLTRAHQTLLNSAFKRSINSLKEFLIDNSDYDNFFEIFETEWKGLAVNNGKTQCPLNLLLPYVDDILNVPMEQRDPLDDVEAMVCEMKRFLLLWKAKLALCKDKTMFTLDVFPLYYMSNACCWQKDKRYLMENKNCVKCTVKLNKTEENIHYASDSDFFLLIQPESVLSEYIDVRYVESLLNIDVLSDRADPRRLVIIAKNSESSMELVFSDPQRCLWAQKEISNTKSACKERYMMLLTKLFVQLENCN